jgi:hypothetical protein
MGQEAKVIYDRRSENDRRNNDDVVDEERRVFRDRRKTESLKLSADAIDNDEFEEIFKQFQKADPETGIIDPNQAAQNLEIIVYQVLYREGVECAYITLLITDEDDNERTLYAFREENENTDSKLESAPMHVLNIFGPDACESYVEQGWNDISKTENAFP